MTSSFNEATKNLQAANAAFKEATRAHLIEMIKHEEAPADQIRLLSIEQQASATTLSGDTATRMINDIMVGETVRLIYEIAATGRKVSAL